MGIRYLNHAATIQCVHRGTLKLFPPPHRSYHTGGYPIVTDVDLMNGKILGCPQAGPGIKPCFAITAILEGEAIHFEVDGQTPILRSFKALTDGNPPGLCYAIDDGHSTTEILGVLSLSDRFLEVFNLALNKLPGAFAEQLKGLITPANLAIMVGAFIASQYIGVGEVIDGALLLLFGRAVATDLISTLKVTLHAKTKAELNQAADHLARATSAVGVVGLAKGISSLGEVAGEEPLRPNTPKKIPQIEEEPNIPAGPEKPPESGRPPDDECQPSCGEPVNSITGAVFIAKTDFVLPGALPLEFSRIYSSQLSFSGRLGPRWVCTWDQYVEAGTDYAVYHGPDGRWIRFELPPDSSGWAANAEVAKFRLRRSEAGFEVHDGQRRLLRFNSEVGGRWLLRSIEDANGHKISFGYDRSGALLQVEHLGGYRLSVEETAKQIRRIVLLNGDSGPLELIRFGYDTQGCLTSIVEGSGLPFRYFWDTNSRITRWEDRNGNWYVYQYDERGRCLKGTGREDFYNWTFLYDDAAKTNVTRDSLGGTTTYVYNARQQMVAKKNARGFITDYTWDRQSNKREERDSAGRGIYQEFDADGNLILSRDALNRSVQFRYNELGLPEACTDAAGNAWTRRYDERGNLVEARGPDGAAWRYDRDGNGNIFRVTDPGGYSRRFGYNSHGLLLWATDARGNRTNFTRDALGRVILRQDPLGRETKYVYNAPGKLREVRLPDGNYLRWDYDPEGNLIRRTGPDGKAYKYAYGAFDLLKEIEKPSGGKLRLNYNTEARLTEVENEIHRTWKYQYNVAGQVVREEDFHGRVQRFDYDASGLCIRRLNGANEEILLERDIAGQLIAQRTGDRSGATEAEESSYEYDPLGLIRRAFRGPPRASRSEVTIERDPYGRVLREVQNGRAVESRYDTRGLRIQRIAAGRETNWKWNENGQPVALQLAQDDLIEFEYDAVGRETLRHLGGGLQLRQGYDQMDRLISQWAGPADANASASAIVDRRWRYDANGDPVQTEDSRWGGSTFAYDSDGRIAQAERARGRSEEFMYDLAGNIAATSERIAAMQGTRGSTVNLSTRFYGKDGRLAQVGETEYRWDADGRLKEKREGSNIWRYEWTADSRLNAIRTPDGDRWAYEYDAFGRRVAKNARGGSTSYFWDGSTIAAEESSQGLSAEWVYEPDSFRPMVKREQSTSWRCLTDQIGTPQALLDRGGRVDWLPLVSAWGGVTESSRDAQRTCLLRFQGQWFDAESGLHYNFHRYYDPEIGQYISSDPIGLGGGMRSYGYVHNPLSWIDPVGLCASDSTISASSPNGNPAAIARGIGSLNARQAATLEQLPGYGSRTIVGKGFGQSDLAALTAETGDEFAMFTTGGRRLIVRGNPTSVPINPDAAADLSAQGWRWSAHTHPGFDSGVLRSSIGDRGVLSAMQGKQSAILNSTGQRSLFGPSGDLLTDWLPW